MKTLTNEGLYTAKIQTREMITTEKDVSAGLLDVVDSSGKPNLPDDKGLKQHLQSWVE